jgi:hypothetical protein
MQPYGGKGRRYFGSRTCASNAQGEPATPEEIYESTKQMIGGLAPYLCFGVAQHEAWLKAAIIGATPDDERCVRMATRRLRETDPTTEAVAVIHTGLLFVAALKAGIDPADAGTIVDHALGSFLPAEAPVSEPAADY